MTTQQSGCPKRWGYPHVIPPATLGSPPSCCLRVPVCPPVPWLGPGPWHGVGKDRRTKCYSASRSPGSSAGSGTGGILMGSDPESLRRHVPGCCWGSPTACDHTGKSHPLAWVSPVPLRSLGRRRAPGTGVPQGVALVCCGLVRGFTGGCGAEGGGRERLFPFSPRHPVAGT